MENAQTYQIEFDGSLLRRGFWLYVWRIKSGDQLVLYVGRTGDSSSNFASSPFTRISRHLDLKENAKSNSLVRRLRDKKLDLNPEECDFIFTAWGPLFEERSDSTDEHRKLRDRTGAMEKLLAAKLEDRGYKVIGNHHSKSKPSDEDVAHLDKFIEAEFPNLKAAQI